MDYREIEKRIDELNLDGYKHIKNNDWDMPGDLFNWLMNHGFDFLGHGMYSAVLKSKDENFIVKINKGHIDQGYLKFVEFCQNNKNNPHLPKMGKIKKYENWYIIFIEKLEPVDIEQLFKLNNYNDLLSFFRDVISYFAYNPPPSRDEKVKYFYKKLEEKEFDILHSDPYVIQLYDICELMAKMCNELNYSPRDLDIHDDNIMLRGKTLVVTDPIT